MVDDDARACASRRPAGLADGSSPTLGMVDGYAEVQGPIDRCTSRGARTASPRVERVGDPMGFETVGPAAHRATHGAWTGCPRGWQRQVARQLAGEHQTDRPWTSSRLTELRAEPCCARPWRSRSARCGRTRGSHARSADPARSVPWARHSPRTPSRSSSPAIGSCAPTGTSASTAPAGPEAKRAVLATEGVDPDELERLAGRRRPLHRLATRRASSAIPSCRHARRVTTPPSADVPFRRRRAGSRVPSLQGVPSARRRRVRGLSPPAGRDPGAGPRVASLAAARPPTRRASATGTHPLAVPRGAGERCPPAGGRPRPGATGTARSRRSGS